MKRTIVVLLSLLLVLGTIPAQALTETQQDDANEFAAFQAAAEPICEVRPIKVPVAGHFPDSLFKYPYKANKYNNTSSNASVGNGFAQTLTWEPAIEKTFLPDTEYTVTLTLEPNAGWQNCGMPGTTRSFAANNITPAQIAGLPEESDPGVKSVAWEYQGVNLIINITFNATGAVSEAPDLIFYEDFSKGVHEDKTIGEGYFMMAQEANRQGMSNWRDANTSVRKRADGGNELVLGYRKDPTATTSSDAYIKNNFVSASGVRTRGRTAAQGGGAYGIDDIIYENAYGYYEANVKFPAANVVWGAFWLFSPATAASLPISEGGSKYATEIDVIESIGYMSGNANIAANFNAAYHTYRASADRDQTNGPRRGPSPNRDLIWPGETGWATASRIGASEEVYIPSSRSRTGVNIYDGQFHKIAIEWSPTDYIFSVDGVVFGSWKDMSSHYRSNGGAYSDWPWINQNEGVMQNPAYIKLTVEAADWADETSGPSSWGSDPNNPWAPNRRLGVTPNAGEMVVDYVYVLNGPKPAGYEPPQPQKTELPVLFENGQWADVLGDITVQTPGLTSEWAYEDGMIRLYNGVPTSRDVEFRFVFDNLLDIRGYSAVIMELEEAPTSWFRSMLRFRIDEDTKNWDSSSHTNVIRMTGGVDRQRLRGVGALPNYGTSVRIKKIYLEGDGVITTQNAINIPYITDILPPRTGNTPVKAITSSGQYTGTVEWSPDHAVFEADTEYTATITLTPKIGWTLTGVAANYFRIYNPVGSGSGATGTGYGTTHAAGSGVITKTFPKTKEPLPYPDPTQFIALSFDDVYLTDTEKLVDALDKYGIKGTFFANGINIERAKTNPDKKRALDKLVAGGHEFGNHAYQHERYTNSADENVTRDNFSRNQAVILELTGQTPRWSRIPYASQGTMSLRVVGEFGLTNLRGFATNDWDLQYSSSWLVNTMLAQTGNNAVRDGQIYVCHDQIGQTNTAQAIPEYYHELRSRGVGFMKMSDLRAHRDFTATPGVNYANFFQNSSQTGTITLNTQPTAPAANLVEGDVSGNLSVAATGTSLSYQWYVTTTVDNPVWTPVAGATGATLALPADLTAGTHYFYCKVNASNAPSKTSDVVAVAIQPPPPTIPVLFEHGQWAEALGEITVQTPRSIDGHYMWSYDKGMIRLTNDVSGAISTGGQNSIPFRWQFQNTIDIRGYSAVVFELDSVPTQPFLRQLRFRIDEDNTTSGTINSTTVRMTSFTDAQRLRGVGALPSNGDVVRIKKIYLEGTGVLAAPAAINRREIRDVIPPRTGNVPVREIVTSPQYTGTVEWSPDHDVFQENTVYTATITLTPREGWTLSGVAANWFQLFIPKGTGTTAAAGSGTTHAAGSGIVTKTFPATTPVIPYPDPTQFVVLSFDDTISPETNDLLDVLDSLGIKANFFTIGMNLEKSNRFPEYARVVSRLKNDGHEPGNHTWQHERWTRATQAVRLADWTANNNYMVELFGKAPTWIRFPYNDQNASAVSDASALNLANLWGFDTNDWDIQHSASYLINRFLTQTSAANMARDGQVYVDHDHYDNQNSTRWALPEIAHYFRSMGIDFMTASELSKRNNFTIVPGTTYNNFFLPSRITIGTQPAEGTTVTEGLVSGSLTVSATVSPAAAPSYQWFCRDSSADAWTAVEGGTGATLELPAGLTMGTWYFYAVASAPNAAPVTSNVVAVVCDRVNLSLRTSPVTYISSDAEYTLSLAKAQNVLAVEVEFEIDGSMLAGKGIEGLNGFEPMNNILWLHAGGDKWKGTVTLALPSGSAAGLTSEAPVDIAKFIFAPKGFGNATMALTGARAVDVFGDTTKYLVTGIGECAATTIVARSKYDLNRDGVVDALDLGIMLLYCGFDADSADWDALVKVNDAWGNPVTASVCDVNGDGLIDMLDLLDLFIHYTK